MRSSVRLLPLAACIALCLDAAAADRYRPADWSLCPVQDVVPVFQPPRNPDGTPQQQLPTDIEGDEQSGTDKVPVFSGNVALSRGNQFLGTDKITFDTATGNYTAEGNVRYQDERMRMVAGHAEGNQEQDSHKVEDVTYQLTSRRGNGGADRIEMQGSQGALYGATYSACPPDARAWEVRAPRIDLNTEEGFGVARNATLRVGRVPVLYVPWFKFPLDERRQTGLLYPAISMSGRNGFDWRQPIYFNLAPNYDWTFTPRLMTKRGLLLGNQFRYMDATRRGELDVAILPSDRLAARGRAEEAAEIAAGRMPAANRRRSTRGMLQFQGSQDLGAHWQARAFLRWMSDPRWADDMSNSIDGSGLFAFQSTVGVYGQGVGWSAAIDADRWQLADYRMAPSQTPFNRMPRAYVHWESSMDRRLQFGVDAEAVRFRHNEDALRPGGSRVDLKPYLSMPFEGAAWFVRPTVAWRFTGYSLDDRLARTLGSATRATRSLPIASIDAGLYLERETTLGGNPYLNTLEPRLFYLYAPYRDQSRLPIFDTLPMSFSWGQLFRDNRYSGPDRQIDANQLTLAATTRFIRQSDGVEKLSASAGLIQYFSDSRVALPYERPVEKGRSAWVVDANYAVNDRWTMGLSYQWDPKYRRQDLASFRTRYFIGDNGIVNFAYRNRRGLLEQVDLSFLYPVTPNWSVVGRYYYSLMDKQLLEGVAGLQWESCCVAARVVGRRYLRNRGGEMNTAIQLEIELKGLGSAGPDLQERLRRSILGYYREDLYLMPPPQVQDGRPSTSPISPP